MIFLMVPSDGLSLQVLAATSLSDLAVNGLSAEYNGGTWTASSNGISGTAEGSSGCGGSAGKGTVVLTNDRGVDAQLSFDYTLELNGGSVTIGGSGVTASGHYEATLESEDNLSIAITTKTGAYTTSINITNISLVVDKEVTVTFGVAENGSYTVDGNEITEAYTNTQSSTISYNIVATPKEGYQFLGWYDSEGNSLSTNSSTSLIVENDVTVTPKFVPIGNALFSVNGTNFDDLNDAVSYAQDKNATKIIVAVDGLLPSGDYTIPEGITLLVPFDEAGTCYTVAPANVSINYTKPSAFRTLTMASNAHLEVNGAISVSAKHAAAPGSGNCGGSPSGKVGMIQMESDSSITINNGGAFYVWGFVTGNGTVDANSGAQVYENFQIADFRGGTATSSLASGPIFPFSQYYVQNIEVPLTMKSGAKEVVYSSLYAGGSVSSTSVEFIGDSGMFKLADGSTLTKSYDSTTDRLIFDLNGDAELKNLTVTVSIATVNSANFNLPINNNITINVHSGTTSINQSLALQAGAEVQIDKGATLNITTGKNVFVYDAEQWGNYVLSGKFVAVPYSPTRSYNRTNSDIKDVVVDVNGEIIVNGGIYTTESGAAIISSDGTGKVTFINGVGTVTSTQQYENNSTKVSISVTNAKLQNGDESYTDTTNAGANTTYTYNKSQEKWVAPCTEHTASEAVKENEVEATCGEQGSYDSVVYCSVCGEEISRETITTPTTDHDWDEGAVTVAATCTEAGLMTYTCKNDSSHTKTEEIPALGHDYESVVTAPTCTEQGYTTHTCKNDSTHTYVDNYVNPTGHAWDEGVVTTEAGCTEEGVKTYTCTVCGETKTEVISATGHTEVTDEAVEPTCTEPGLTEGSHCGICGAVIVEQKVVPALGHSWNDGEITTEPTCTEAGEKTYTCTVCDETKTEVVPALGHDYESVVTSPTCTERGYTTYTCTRDDASYVSNYIEATGHKYDDGVVTKEETCTEAGVMTYTCTVCGDTKTEEIPAHGHSYTGEVTKAATCTEDGVMTYTCTFDESHQYTETIPSTGHTVVVDEAVEPTCTETGLTEGSHCSVCDEVIKAQQTIPALRHEYQKEISTPSATEKCTITYTCSRCDDSYTENPTGLVDIDDDTYFFDEDSHAVSGLVRVQKDNGEINYYYFGDDFKAYKATEETTQYKVENVNGLKLISANYTFDENGVIAHFDDTSINGIYYDETSGNYYYCVDGVIQAKGLFKEDDSYYYARTSSGALVCSRDYWITLTNGLLDEGVYTFDETGKIVFPDEEKVKDGIVEEDGSLYYYENGKRVGAGLIQIDGAYYYVRTSTGEVIHGRDYWISQTNDLLPAGIYTFDETGKIVLPDKEEVKDGIVEEDGSLYYYENGERVGAGLIQLDGAYYYVRTSNGEVIHGRSYWITVTNDLLPSGLYNFGDDGKMIVE